MAVGGFWGIPWIFPPSWGRMPSVPLASQLLPFLLIGLCLGAGMLASVSHLGNKKNAWRVLSRLRKSSLSREVLFAGLFGLGWLFTVLEIMIWQRSSFEGMAISSILGLGLIYNMAQVYRFPAAPGWNTWRTNAAFMVSALSLGLSVMSPVLVYESEISGSPISSAQWGIIGTGILLLLLAQLGLMHKPSSDSPFPKIRVGLLSCGILLTAASLLPFDLNRTWMSAIILLIVLTEEGLGRWLFYRSRV
jgi:DMSO reductase anchor subunit